MGRYLEVSKGWSEAEDGDEKVPGYPGVWIWDFSQRKVVALGRYEADWVVRKREDDLSLAEKLTTLKSASSLPMSLGLLSFFSIPSILLILPKTVSQLWMAPRYPSYPLMCPLWTLLLL